MKMYHISTDIFKDIKEFVPRIPERKMNNEDSSIPRVCISDSIENCLNGLLYLNNYRRFVCRDSETNFDIFSDGECYRVFKVYEFDIDSSVSIKTPEYIYSNNLVPDALFNNEYWSTDTIIPNKSYLIQIKNSPEVKEIKLEETSGIMEIINKIDFVSVNGNDIAETIEIKFNKVDEETLEFFGNNSDCGLIYDIEEIFRDKIIISTNSYPTTNKNIIKILNNYFKYYPNYQGVSIC